MTTCDSFGEWIRQRRRTLDLTRMELANCVGCSVSALRKIESDERRPSKQLAELLAECLQVPLDQREVFLKVARGTLRVALLVPLLPQDGITIPDPSLSNPDTNLPTASLSLVGREVELATLSRLLAEEHCRLLTLAGPGGIGKTRLAIEAAARQQSVFADGVFFVPLASVSSTEFLVPAIAKAVKLSFQGSVDMHTMLLNYLRPKQILLVLDNVEHLLDADRVISEILGQAPRIKLLVTSRERLRLQEEWVFGVEGLPVSALELGKEVSDHGAVALFVLCARRANASFQLQPADWPAVVHICQMVEGMPLGIELAAAWTQMLSCQEIADEIERNLDFLATSMRDVPERQRSLRATFDHSWNLLSAMERSALSQLAIFQGSFDRSAGEEIAGADLSLLSALVSKSLVRRTTSGRYDLHQVVRQYALSHLAKDEAARTAVHDRHCEFYLTLLRDLEKALKGDDQQSAIRELTEDMDDLRVAWRWAVQREKFEVLGPAVRCFGLLHDIRGLRGEGFSQLELVVRALRNNAVDPVRQSVLGQALGEQGMLRFRMGQYDKAGIVFEESLALLRPLGDPALLSHPLIFYAVVLLLSGELDRSSSFVEEVLQYAHKSGDTWIEAHGLFALGTKSFLSGQYTAAYEEKYAGLELYRKSGDLHFTGMALNYLVLTLIKLGLYEEAHTCLDESLELCTQIDDRWGIGTAYCHQGLVALAEGELVEAQRLFDKSAKIFTELDARWDHAQTQIFMGDIAVAAGNYAEAHDHFLKTLPLALEVRAMPLVLDILTGLANCQLAVGDAEKALELLTFVTSHHACTPEAREGVEPLREAAIANLHPDIVAAIQDRAFQVNIEQMMDSLGGNGYLLRPM